MLRRKIISDLERWKEELEIKKKALVIKGARQVGKTTIAKEFAKNNYESVIYINFKNNESIKPIFDGDFIVDSIMRNISAIMIDVKLIPYNTVLLFDEIQECANARAAIKAFMEDGRYDIICTGSLLGIKGYNKKNNRGVPTGFEKTIYMKSMDFEEFLWAKGISIDLIDYLKECYNNRSHIDEAINKAFINYFKEYICVGGMPEIVNLYIKTNDMNLVRNTQRDLLEEYKDDFGKHLNKEEQEVINKVELTKILAVFDSIPNQLAKENKKFQYSKINAKARSSEYEAAIEWLKDAGIISICYNLSNLELPLEGNAVNNIFKIYMQDSGLFIAMLDDSTAGKILLGNLGVYKGAIYENIVADAFAKNNKRLYYYHKDSGLEIDFITSVDDEVALLEVKATNGKIKSSHTILENYNKYHVKKCIKLIEGSIGFTDNVLTIPYYLAFLI